MNNNWEWVRATYSQATPSRASVVDDEIPYPSCLANGLSLEQKRALLQVYSAAYEQAEARVRHNGQRQSK